jgi:hypothetical protein
MSAERLYSALQVGLSLCEVKMALMNIIAAMNGNYFQFQLCTGQPVGMYESSISSPHVVVSAPLPVCMQELFHKS